MNITGTISTVALCIIYCVSRCQNNRKVLIALDLLAKVVSFILFLSFGEKTGFVSEVVGLTVLIMANVKAHSKRKFTGLFIFYFIAYLVIMKFTYSGVTSVLVAVIALASLICNWYLNSQQIRIVDVLLCILTFKLDMLMGNIAGYTELIIMTVNIAAIRYNKIPSYTSYPELYAENKFSAVSKVFNGEMDFAG